MVVEKNGSYSLDEVQTSETWIDGKPIYKKNFNISNTANFASGKVALGVAIPNIANVIDNTLIVQANSSNRFKEATYFRISALTMGVLDNGNLGVYSATQIDSMIANTMVCTVWYTKTTD
ncbi:MAG: hypothetical protein LBG96_02455 [Tannerella sp.]|nr:hypothetical protein [Tannerella sp.]